jgi:Zn finger protein HypA/HybF involved in hydrogenase expression
VTGTHDPYPLLKNGSTQPYYRCDCCGHYVRKLSARAWCVACEHEVTEVGKRAREKIRLMTEATE